MTTAEVKRKYLGNIAWGARQLEQCAMDMDMDGVETQLDYICSQLGLLEILLSAREAREEMET